GGGRGGLGVAGEGRGLEGRIRLGISDLPKGVRAEGGFIAREYLDASGARTVNRRGVLLVTADRDVPLNANQLHVWGEGKLSDGTVLKRQARGLGMVVDVTGATEQGAVDRQRALTAPWLDLELPVSIGDPPAATLQGHQTAIK